MKTIKKDFQLLSEQSLLLIASGKMSHEQIKKACARLLAERGLEVEK